MVALMKTSDKVAREVTAARVSGFINPPYLELFRQTGVMHCYSIGRGAIEWSRFHHASPVRKQDDLTRQLFTTVMIPQVLSEN
jgi:hypothetical protein